MGFFKLEKLSIYKFSEDQGKDVGPPLKVMFNPQSFITRHNANYSPQRTLPIPGKSGGGDDMGSAAKKNDATFLSRDPETLELTLIFDGTGVSEYGLEHWAGVALGRDISVKKRVQEFLKLCIEQKEATHVPNPLHVLWGIIDFKCVLKNNVITYSVFDRSGEPLRAEMQVVFLALKGQSVSNFGPQELSSPDLTHAHQVKAGDTLPVLVKKIYGTSQYYLQIARINKLKNFRRLTPGQTLLFPPLDQKNPL